MLLALSPAELLNKSPTDFPKQRPKDTPDLEGQPDLAERAMQNEAGFGECGQLRLPENKGSATLRNICVYSWVRRNPCTSFRCASPRFMISDRSLSSIKRTLRTSRGSCRKGPTGLYGRHGVATSRESLARATRCISGYQ